MARKPHSVFLIIDTPHSATTSLPGTSPSTLNAWRIPLQDGEDAEAAMNRWFKETGISFGPQSIGTTLYVVEDTKVQGHEFGLKLTPIEDPRLDEDQEDDPTVGLGIERG